MKTTEFDSKLTAEQLNEGMFKKFGVKVNFDKYTREELENYRNLIRTNISQYENQTSFNDLLTDENYQKNKYLVGLLNQKIKEMLGESAKKDKTMKKTIESTKSKKSNRDWDGDGKIETNKDEVWGSRAKAAARAGKPFKEEMKVGDTKKTRTGVVTKTATGVVHKNTSHSDEPHGQLPSKVKSKSAAEKQAQAPKQKQSPKSAKTWGMKDGVKFDNRTDEGLPMVKGPDGKMVPKFAADGKGKKDLKKQKMEEARAIFRQHVRTVNESLALLLQEDEEGKAKAITAASDMVNDYTTWMQRVGQYQTKSMIELADTIRAEFGQMEAETFKQAVAPALAATLETLTSQREAISQAVAVLAGEATETVPMGSMQQGPEGMDGMAAEPDSMNAGDEFGASDAAAGGPEAAGRELRESQLIKAHNIMRSLSR